MTETKDQKPNNERQQGSDIGFGHTTHRQTASSFNNLNQAKMNKNKLFIFALLIATLMITFSFLSCGVRTTKGQVLDFPTSSYDASYSAISANPSDVLRTITFDYIALDSIINELSKDPLWTDGELTMFRDNCRRFLLDESHNPRKFVIVINESTEDISINGRQDLHDTFRTLPTGYEMGNQARLYRQVKYAIEEARHHGIYNLIFKEI